MHSCAGFGPACVPEQFAADIVAWQAQYGRRTLPWQGTDPYQIWLSEIMLQQTQVAAVLPYFERFLARFADVRALAAAPLDEVLALWSGLGYYSRARHLHRAAQMIENVHHGVFPRTAAALEALPGVGRSTAAAIAAFAFNERVAILDGNVKRVLARVCAVQGYPGRKEIETRLWQYAQALLPHTDLPAYTQGMMDLGALVCVRSRPRCTQCPVVQHCLAHAQGRQAELPTPRPARSVPTRALTLLCLTHHERIWVERRPERGVWGGLYCLPAFPEQAGALLQSDERPSLSAIRAHFHEQGHVRELHEAGQFEHRFTHFHLQARVVQLHFDIPPAQPSASGQWVTHAQCTTLGLPAPVRRFVQHHMAP